MFSLIPRNQGLCGWTCPYKIGHQLPVKLMRNNQNGVLGSGQTVSISAASLDNSHDGSLVSDGSLTARINGLFDNQNGDLSAKGVIDLQTGSLDNRNGSLIGKDRLTLRSDSLDNCTGKVRAGQRPATDRRTTR